MIASTKGVIQSRLLSFIPSQINWQMAMLQTEDLMKAAMASSDRSGKSVPEFADVV
jgi:hypothetical protein